MHGRSPKRKRPMKAAKFGGGFSSKKRKKDLKKSDRDSPTNAVEISSEYKSAQRIRPKSKGRVIRKKIYLTDA